MASVEGSWGPRRIACAAMARKIPGVVATNRSARRDFEILDTYECGIALQGSEVKSLRDGRVQLGEGFGRIADGEVWMHNVHISPYQSASRMMGHTTDRPRKLLLHRVEIDRMRARVDQDGLTLVPLAIYFKDGRAKLELGLARRKRKADRRQDIAKRDADLEARRAIAHGARYAGSHPPD
ncbi:MAG: SsrA-binding protein SmpB [Acidimicrobiales bacterium]|nr:SsrA-binding protein SmpB [Acidimicrobiales bacterium]